MENAIHPGAECFILNVPFYVIFEFLCSPLLHYNEGHSDLMWSDTPTLCGRTPRPYVVGHPVPMLTVSPSLCLRSLRPYVAGHSGLMWARIVPPCTILASGFVHTKPVYLQLSRHPWRNVQTQLPHYTNGVRDSTGRRPGML